MLSIRLLTRTLVFIIALWPQPSYARRTYDYGIDRSMLLKRQGLGSYAVTGTHTGSGLGGSVPLRQEIRKIEQDKTTWNLYILGLDMLQYTNQTEMLSWYQLAGIHGRPYIPFDNVQPLPGDANNGYCMHVSILFPTWHRPYLALYEQVLYELIQEIASLWPQGPTRDQYVAAAANFRIPYWDWASPTPPGESSILPDSIGGSPVMLVDGPSGEQLIANPLYDYQFKPLDTSSAGLPDAPFSYYETTMRYPTTNDITAVSRNDIMRQQLDANAKNLRSRLFNLFTSSHVYSQFSNEAWYDSHPNPPIGYDSIESIHDMIHGLTGGGNGHMSYIEYSAFDPIFFLHHAMIDRCFAMWQVLNPNSYVVDEPSKYSTYTSSAGQIQTSSSSLTPFYQNADGVFWDSNSVQSTEAFGYAYTETSNPPGANITAQVISAINNLYGEIKTNLGRKRDGTLDINGRDQGTKQREWIANIKVEKNALAEPFFIHIFVGPFNNANPEGWSLEPSLVGSHFIFTKAITSNCPSCDPNQLVTATIPITSSLLRIVANGELASLQPTDVVPFLMSNLKYRVVRLNNEEVGNGEVPSLKISIVSANVSMPVDDGCLPKWGQMIGHMDVSAS